MPKREESACGPGAAPAGKPNTLISPCARKRSADMMRKAGSGRGPRAVKKARYSIICPPLRAKGRVLKRPVGRRRSPPQALPQKSPRRMFEKTEIDPDFQPRLKAAGLNPLD